MTASVRIEIFGVVTYCLLHLIEMLRQAMNVSNYARMKNHANILYMIPEEEESGVGLKVEEGELDSHAEPYLDQRSVMVIFLF